MNQFKVQEYLFWGASAFLLGCGFCSLLPRDNRMVSFFFSGVLMICSVIYEVSSDKR